MLSPTAPDFVAARLKPLAVGILLALFAFAYGFTMGAAFGAAEDSIKGQLKADADAALPVKYNGDAAKAKAVVDKSWAYLKRAHLHSGVLGACALSMILLLALLGNPGWPAKIVAFLLGFGALFYGMFWALAGFAAPGLGSTDAAKESLQWLALPSSGAMLVGLFGTIALTIKALWFTAKPEPPTA